MSIRGLGTVGQVTVGCLGRRRDRPGGLQVGAALANQLGGPVTSLHGEAAQAVAPIPVES
jgi:hypothetical protein